MNLLPPLNTQTDPRRDVQLPPLDYQRTHYPFGKPHQFGKPHPFGKPLLFNNRNNTLKKPQTTQTSQSTTLPPLPSLTSIKLPPLLEYPQTTLNSQIMTNSTLPKLLPPLHSTASKLKYNTTGDTGQGKQSPDGPWTAVRKAAAGTLRGGRINSLKTKARTLKSKKSNNKKSKNEKSKKKMKKQYRR